jgi:hypothetical protein
MRFATAMEAPATSAAMGTAATAVAAATVLSECCIWRESETDENSKYDEGFAKTESAHNPYLPSNVGVQFRARSPCTT